MAESRTWRDGILGAGLIAVGITAAAASVSVVHAERAAPDAKNRIWKCTSGTACLSGVATGGVTDGVFGSSSGRGTHGVYGTSNWAGVTGYTGARNGSSGVFGQSTSTTGSANGVYGNSSNGPGVYATSSGSNGTGAMGGTSAAGSSGAYGYNKRDGNGIVAESNDSTFYPAAGGYALNYTAQFFKAYNKANDTACTIDSSASLTCSGGVSGSVLRAEHRSGSGRPVLAYVSEAASEMIEDFGTARMFEGVANVPIDPAFASVMDRAWYYVSLTPLGDTRGLYVSAKTAAAFQVRESGRGRDSLAFDYRIVAHSLDVARDRLSPAPAFPRPPRNVRHGEER
jgi:hypothetical protein